MKSKLSTTHFIYLLTIATGLFLLKKYDITPAKIKNLFSKSKNTTGLVTAFNGKKIIATINDFEDTLNILKQAEPGIQYLSLLSQEEHKRAYQQLLNNYIITNYLVNEYLETNGIKESEEVKKEYNNFIKTISTTFYSNIFQKEINKTLIIVPEEVEAYYDKHKDKYSEFMAAPFIIETPGVEARATKIESNKHVSDYKELLKSNSSDQVINLGRVRHGMLSMTADLIEKLLSMKDGEFSSIVLPNGMNFALYRIKEYKGKWAPFKEVSRQAEQIMRSKELEKRCLTLLNELKEKQAVLVHDEPLNELINKNRHKEISKEETPEEIIEEVTEVIENENIKIS